eukprot:TRINITY_DN4393_c0_g1_i5.p1 TRINITY_DN4393_c0_g1~~TRINITY_DN4393_c0_g1_i5.p1  ORF type:complete len:158 (+),score=47.69 TRINITY_DN4393_c0_g1_i5:251-724(+)
MGAYFHSKQIKIKESEINLAVWDTAGEEKFDSLTTYYCKGAQAALVCYEITSSSSFEKLQHWVSKVQEQAMDSCVIAIVGNKLDLVEEHPDQRQVPREEAEKYASSIGATLFEVSAKSGKNVENAFMETVTRCLNLNDAHSPSGNIKVKQASKSPCC